MIGLLIGCFACGEATPGRGTSEVRVDVFLPDTADAEVPVVPDVDGASEADLTPADSGPSVLDTVADAAETRDTVTDTALTQDTAGPEASPDPAACPVPTLLDDYPGALPPFPYAAWPRAEGCVAEPHDVLIVLGCPSESDGSPSTCQIERAKIADQLYEAHWADHFIVTGAAVHNAHVEADALFLLLVARGIPADAILEEPLAQHTDENLYYATRLMQDHGWTSALVVSEDPGHLMMTALCDANCCVDLGRMTLLEWEVLPDYFVKAGHYALIPPAAPNTDAECRFIASKIMCLNQSDRRACKDDFQLTR